MTFYWAFFAVFSQGSAVMFLYCGLRTSPRRAEFHEVLKSPKELHEALISLVEE
jgi:hypothetical protein